MVESFKLMNLILKSLKYKLYSLELYYLVVVCTYALV